VLAAIETSRPLQIDRPHHSLASHHTHRPNLQSRLAILVAKMQRGHAIARLEIGERQWLARRRRLSVQLNRRLRDHGKLQLLISSGQGNRQLAVIGLTPAIVPRSSRGREAWISNSGLPCSSRNVWTVT